jgi:hypothetical protein
MSLLGRTLRLKNDTLEFFKDRERLVGVIYLGVALFLADKKANLFEALEFSLYVSSIFFDKLGEATDMGLKIRILGIDHNNLAADS